MAKPKGLERSDTEIRTIVHEYFYQRSRRGTSERGKNGYAAKISVIKAELKQSHQLTPAQVIGAIMYLKDQGWLAKEEVEKSFTTDTGTTIPSTVAFYRISADGVDKIEGKGKYSMPKYDGINITATDQAMVTIGDHNVVNAKFESAAQSLETFKSFVKKAIDVREVDKLSIVSDIESIQSQLAKPEPNRSVLKALWSGVETAVGVTSLAANLTTVAQVLSPLF